MGNRTAIILLGVALALAAFIFFFERGSMTTDERAERRNRVFSEFRRDKVEALSVTGAGGVRISLERLPSAVEGAEAEFQITEPMKVKADATEVGALEGAIDYLLRDRTVKDANALSNARFGLVRPRLSGSFTINGKTTSFKVGGDAEGDKVYLAVDGAPGEVYAVDKEFLKSMDKPLADLRDKRLVAEKLDGALRLNVSRPAGPLALGREKDGPWRLEEGDSKILAAADEVSQVQNAIEGVRAKSFVADGVRDEGLGKYGLAPAGRTIRIALPDGKELALLVGGPCEGGGREVHVTVAGSGTVACAGDEFLAVVDRPVARFRETRPAVFADDDVTRVTLARKGRSLVLEKGDKGWRIAGQTAADADEAAVTDLLAALRDTRASAVVAGDEAMAKLGEPLATATLTLQGKDEALSVFAGASDGEERVRRGDEKAVLTIKAGLAALLEPEPVLYRDRETSVGEGYEAVAMTLKGPAAQELAKDGDEWKLTAPVKAKADGAIARTLADIVGDLKARRFVAPRALPEHGLSNPWAAATVRYAAGKESPKDKAASKDKTVALELGAEVKDGKGERYARLGGGDGAVFVVGPDTGEALAKPMLSREVFDLGEPDLRRVEIVSASGTIALERGGEAWKAEGPSAPDPDKARRLVTDIAALRAVRVASFGVAPAGFGLDTPTLTIRVWNKDADTKAEPSAVLSIGARSDRKEDDGFLARKAGLDANLVIPARLVNDLSAAPSPVAAARPDAGPR
ncbi:MAG: DUF4340 domain-containing protein [Deltaproteobacteria bacterium]|nr:DUF4340 domain-containing protein [Deltaproteobacteria bacterium]